MTSARTAQRPGGAYSMLVAGLPVTDASRRKRPQAEATIRDYLQMAERVGFALWPRLWIL